MLAASGFQHIWPFCLAKVLGMDLAFWTKIRKKDFEIKLPQTVGIGVFRGEKAVLARLRAIGGLQHLQIGNFSKSPILAKKLILVKIAISAPLRFRGF